MQLTLVIYQRQDINNGNGGTRGVCYSWSNFRWNYAMEYVTISSGGGANDFGDHRFR